MHAGGGRAARLNHTVEERSGNMTDQSLDWDEDALKRLEKIPSFVRKMAKAKIEKAAKEAGEERVTSEFMDVNKAKLMG
jgi:hypothetical protein